MQLKVGEKVRVTATNEDLLYIPSYSRIPILDQMSGSVHRIHKDAYEINFHISGIWMIESKFIERYE